MLYYTILSYTILCYTILYRVVPHYYTLWHDTILRCILLYAILHIFVRHTYVYVYMYDTIPVKAKPPKPFLQLACNDSVGFRPGKKYTPLLAACSAQSPERQKP